MNAQPFVSPQNVPERVSALLVFAVFALTVTIAVGVYYFTVGFALNGEIDKFTAENASLEEHVASYEKEQVKVLLRAKEFLAAVSKDAISWSKVIRDVLIITPKNAVTGESKVDYLSFSGGENGSVTMNATTKLGSADPFLDLAELMQAFSGATTMRDAFVPTVARGVTEKGETLLTFVLNLTYHE